MHDYLDFSNGQLRAFNGSHYIFARALNVSQNEIVNFDFLAKIKGLRELISRQNNITELSLFPPTVK